MDDHLVGMKEGESAQFETTIPEDYGNPALAGKTGHYDVTLSAVKYRELPELDDEFAKSMGDYETLAGLRTKVLEQMRSRKEGEARRELRDGVATAAVEQAQMTIHPALVEDEEDAMMREMNRMLAQNRLNMETYLQMVGKTEEEYRKELEPEALGRVKRDLVLSAVADAEGIQVGDDEVEGFLQLFNILNNQRTRPEDLTPGQRASIMSRLRRDNALDRLIDIATEGKGNQIGRRSEEPEEAETLSAGKSEQASDQESEQVQMQGAAEAARAGAQLAGEQSAAPTAATDATETTETSVSNAAPPTTSAPASHDASGAKAAPESGSQSPATPASAATSPPASTASATNATTAQSAETQALSGAAGTEVPKPGE
jgi:trigger factor